MSTAKQIIVYIKHRKIILCKRCNTDITDICFGPRLYCKPCARFTKLQIQQKTYQKRKKIHLKKWQIIINALTEGPKTLTDLKALTGTKNLVALLGSVKRTKKIIITNNTIIIYKLLERVNIIKPSYTWKTTTWETILKALIDGPKTTKQIQTISNTKSVHGMICYLRIRKGFKISTNYVTTYTLRRNF